MDGVLKLNTTPIPEGQQAIKYLQDNKIPFLIVTNASGDLETLVQQKVNKFLQTNLTTDYVVSCSCPIVDIIQKLKPEENVLIIGAKGFSVPFFRKFTKQFNQFYFADDIAHYNNDIVPLFKIYDEPIVESATNTNKQLPKQFDYLIFYCDSINWYSDIQISVDAINQNKNIKIIVTNPDKTFATNLTPRLTIGSEVQCVCSLAGYEEQNIKFLGKPFQYIFNIAKEKAKNIWNLKNDTEFIMIGDQISGDIVGGNRANCTTVLVKTGKDKSIQGKQCDELPDYIFDNVYQAVIKLSQ